MNDAEDTNETEETQRPEVNEAPAKRPLVKGALGIAMSRAGGDSIGSMKGIQRKRATFVVDCGSCEPGMFDEDFELTLQSLDSATELRAAAKSKGDPSTLALWMAYHSLYAVNGVPIDETIGERGFLWEALGGCRHLAMGVFAKSLMPDSAAAGKALRGIRFE